jgi:hypothetical protein
MVNGRSGSTTAWVLSCGLTAQHIKANGVTVVKMVEASSQEGMAQSMKANGSKENTTVVESFKHPTAKSSQALSKMANF